MSEKEKPENRCFYSPGVHILQTVNKITTGTPATTFKEKGVLGQENQESLAHPVKHQKIQKLLKSTGQYEMTAGLKRH